MCKLKDINCLANYIVFVLYVCVPVCPLLLLCQTILWVFFLLNYKKIPFLIKLRVLAVKDKLLFNFDLKKPLFDQRGHLFYNLPILITALLQ